MPVQITKVFRIKKIKSLSIVLNNKRQKMVKMRTKMLTKNMNAHIGIPINIDGFRRIAK